MVLSEKQSQPGMSQSQAGLHESHQWDFFFFRDFRTLTST
ncbi:hypothetical protein GCM10010109_00870 [Actinoplanes campanulatus]|nr:hypothetical protein GCM10010109_00870 [Actinoplanes campanulatus]GID34377.1 hypothetical protein Aca09nite_08830 [Actinoplanes campanulatus]